MATKKAVPARHVLSEQFADADLVDHIFAYLVELHPEIAKKEAEIKDAVREQFGRQNVWIKSPKAERRRELARQVLSLFNGRNATEVARKLNTSRITVYRIIKQAGRPDAVNLAAELVAEAAKEFVSPSLVT